MSDPAYLEPASTSVPKFSYLLGTVIVIALGSMTVASAQSPFATKKKKQAWELPQNTQTQTQTQTQPQSRSQGSQQSEPHYQSPNTQPSPRSYSQPVYSYPSSTPPKGTNSKPSSSVPPQAGASTNKGSSYHYSAPPAAAPQSPSVSPNNGTYYYGQGVNAPPSQAPRQSTPSQTTPYQRPPAQSYPSQSYPPQSYPSQSYPSQSYPPQSNRGPKDWKDKLGLNTLTTLFRGFVKGGAGAINKDDGTNSEWKEGFIGDAKAEFEVSAVTDTGYEYGVNLEARAQYDKYRRGFGGRIPDCPPTEAGCSSALIGGTPTSLRGHTSRFYSFGSDDAKDTEIALESAHLFLRSAYGDFTLGRDDGAAYLFSLGAPSLLAVGASNSPTDYTGLDSVKTINDASGFSEKITYTSPRLLGDSIGVGVQIGGSYAPNARACGVDYCVKRDDVAGTASPDLENIFEVGLALDRTFENGLKMEATATYATGSEQSGFAGFDDLQSYNVGAEVSWMDVTLGGSFLQSNNGLLNGNYQAWDIGATWKPSALGFTLGYGHAKDDNVRLVSDQILAGVSYDFDKFTLGAGAQYIERETYGFNGTTVSPNQEKATALFVEGGFKF